MNRRYITLCTLLLSLVGFTNFSRGQWTAPTAEELSMTSQPEVPGAAAVYLFREQTTDDDLHMFSVYVRLKVLTEAGKEYANVELKQYHVAYGSGYTISEIQARTIHPDGTVIPFTGAPYEKVLSQGSNFEVKAKVFSLPNVEVGSILEYRYKLRYEDGYFTSPDWYVQSELYTRKAHFKWRPTSKSLTSKHGDAGETGGNVAWTKILPKGADFKETRLPSVGYDIGQLVLELNISNVPPTPNEEYMLPADSLSYRVLFYYSAQVTAYDFWKYEGNNWAKGVDKFIGPGPKVVTAVKQLVQASDTDDQKLRKIYAAIMQMDNTGFSRTHTTTEDKSLGLNEARSVDDILDRKRGSENQLAQLFVGMARAAGMKAYLMAVTSRDHDVFLPAYLSLSQLNDSLAIVVVNGQEQYFDPGQRYCPYGQLAWTHTQVQGIRETNNGAAFGGTPPGIYTDSRTERVANLTMNLQGAAGGTVKMTWAGSAALRWRQKSLQGDDTSLRQDLQAEVEHLLPGGMEISVHSIDNLEDYEKPLVVFFDVRGQIASVTGKRMILPGDLFEKNAKPTFPHEKRDIAIYFEYPHLDLDAVRINFPASLTVESLPAPQTLPYEKTAVYSITSESAPTSVTIRRTFLLGDIVVPAERYADLRKFFAKFETSDQDPIVLRTPDSLPAGN